MQQSNTKCYESNKIKCFWKACFDKYGNAHAGFNEHLAFTSGRQSDIKIDR